MNDKIIIQVPSSAKDAAGQPIEGWTDRTPIWGGVRFPTGSEVVRNGLVTATVQASIRVWQRGDIDNSMRAVCRGVSYDIKSVLPDSRDQRFMFIVCESAK